MVEPISPRHPRASGDPASPLGNTEKTRGSRLRGNDGGRNHLRLGLVVAACVFLLDQLSKWIVTYPLALHERGIITLLPIFDLRWVENKGVSMGLLTADGAIGRWLLVLFTAAIAAGVTVWLFREKKREDALALSLVLGGALGNIVDRVRYGYVVDFADLHFGDVHPFLVFNVADAAITIGVLLLLVRAFLTRDDKPVKKGRDDA